MLDLDLAPEDFLAFERDLKKRGIRWVTSSDDAQRLRALAAGWMKEYRPVFVGALGEIDGIVRADEDVKWLRARCGVRSDAKQVRTVLRRIARLLRQDLLPAYDANRWSLAANAEHQGPDDGPMLQRLVGFDEAIASSYQQALNDLADSSRLTYVGPATELREVLGATIRKLSPPDEEAASRRVVGFRV